MKKTLVVTFLMLSLGVLAACGDTKSDRALSGGAIGAGAGVIGGALVGAPGVGALLGGAIGAGAGAVTDRNDIDLGEPIWR